MKPEVAKIVGMKAQPTQLGQFQERLKSLIRISRDEMTKYYDRWDNADLVYRGERRPDLQDIKARKRQEPEKMILPFTYGQVETFVAFGHSSFNQRDYFFEMIASGVEDEKPAEMGSAILERDLTYNRFRSIQVQQFLRDIARFNIGVTKESWTREVGYITEQVPDQQKMAEARAGLIQPVDVPMVTQTREVTKYLGNKIVNVSPYRWFPDVRLPLSRWKEGEFCADEIEYDKDDLKSKESQGLTAGVEYVAELPTEAFAGQRRFSFMKSGAAMSAPATSVNPKYCILTEIQVKLNPSKTEIDEGVMLDPERDYVCNYLVWIANDDRIIRISEAGYDHEEFTYNCAQFLDDQNHFINISLCDILSACQDTATWFMNSHITSVRKNIYNQFVVDTSAIEIDDIAKRSPVIRMKAGRSGSGVNQWIQQLQTTDVTANHISDVTNLSAMAKEATGINDTLLGNIASGRRSAREMGNVANASAQRLGMVLSAIWDAGIAPLGRKMLSNLRQGLDEEATVRVYGLMNTQQAAQPDVPGLPPPLYRLIKVSADSLVGNYDFAVYNGTLPSQRAATAAVLKDLVESMQKDPRMVMLLGLDPQLIVYEILNLLNVRNVQRFRLTPERLSQLTGMAQQSANPAGAGGPRGGGQRPAGGTR